MSKYVKLAIGIVCFIILIVGASVLYNYLSERNNGRQELVTEKQVDSGIATQGAVEGESDAAESEQVGLIDFTVYDKDGNERTLSSFVGKPIVLNFWASWCSPCKSEFPDFQEVYETCGEDIEFIMVNLTDGVSETREKADAFVKAEGYTLPIYYDEKQSAAYAYSVYSIPTTYFIDTNGNIITYAQGMIDKELLEQGISMIKEE